MSKTSRTRPNPRVVVRPLRVSDYDGVAELQRRCYPGLDPWTKTQFKNQLRRFPEGQIGVELDKKIAATCTSVIIDEDILTDTHTYQELLGGDDLSTHNEDGDILYGLDIAVDPAYRGLRLARRLYDARKEIVAARNLRGIAFGGRIPGYHRQAENLSPEEYVAKVLKKELRDPGITAQRSNGFQVRGLLHNYMPSDWESCGHAVYLRWDNPAWVPSDRRKPQRSIRVAAVQYQMRSISSFEEFATQCEFFIDTAADYKADFLVFPELMTNQLLALVPAARPAESARNLHTFTERYIAFFGDMAIKYNVNILAGTHLTLDRGALKNCAYLFHRDGRMDKQVKLHLTPSERRWWGVEPGNAIKVLDTDRGKIAIAVGHDVEFPELARYIKSKGAEVLFVPYNTDIRSAHLRMRVCAQARAIENHLYVVTAGAVGNLPQVGGADIHYAESAILTPSDIAFARDGIGAVATPNVETMLVHDLDMATLRRTEATGTVRTWTDRRTDLYSVGMRVGRKVEKI